MNTMKTILRDLEGEYTIRVMDLPEGSRGFVLFDADDHANIYINARLSPAEQRKAADHELRHVANNDIYNDEDIRSIEARADGSPDPQPVPVPETPTVKQLDMLLPPLVKGPVPPQPLTDRQHTILTRAIADLDRFLFDDFELDY